MRALQLRGKVVERRFGGFDHRAAQAKLRARERSSRVDIDRFPSPRHPRVERPCAGDRAERRPAPRDRKRPRESARIVASHVYLAFERRGFSEVGERAGGR